MLRRARQGGPQCWRMPRAKAEAPQQRQPLQQPHQGRHGGWLPPLNWPVPSCWELVKALVQGAEEEELGPAESADLREGDSHAHGARAGSQVEVTCGYEPPNCFLTFGVLQ